MFFMGIDVGTNSTKVIICNASGEILGTGSSKLSGVDSPQKGWREQHPTSWWDSVCKAVQQALGEFKLKGFDAKEIKGIAVDSTSGTIVPVDFQGQPLMNAIMYNDSRSTVETQIIRKIGTHLEGKLGYKFSPSYALPKILWIKQNRPQVYNKTYRFLHAADFIIAKLTGVMDYTDYSNALKTGYDLVDFEWPDFIKEELDLDLEKFPDVKAPGEFVSPITKKVSAKWGLGEDCVVVTGMTDGCAGLVASGAVSPGEACSILGTTLVIKAISKQLIKDDEGRVYCHRHPEGFWMPGGASNTGGECLENNFAGMDFALLDSKAIQKSPTSIIIYPLERQGERFPFNNPKAESFIIGKPTNDDELYCAYLEGVGYLERLAYDVLHQLGCPVGENIYVTDGGSKSPEWLQIRSNILGKVLLKPKNSDGAMGMAILAASKIYYNNLTQAVKNMVQIEKVVEPQHKIKAIYDERYETFTAECRRRGYI